MSDKAQLIKKEIERLHELLPVVDGDNVSINYAEGICIALEKYIDSLPKESGCEVNFTTKEELEKEFNRFLDEVEGVPRMWHSDEQMEWGKDIARHFAEWQKQKDMQDFLEKAEKWLEPTFKNIAGYNCGGDLMNDFKNYIQNE